MAGEYCAGRPANVPSEPPPQARVAAQERLLQGGAGLVRPDNRRVRSLYAVRRCVVGGTTVEKLQGVDANLLGHPAHVGDLVLVVAEDQESPFQKRPAEPEFPLAPGHPPQVADGQLEVAAPAITFVCFLAGSVERYGDQPKPRLQDCVQTGVAKRHAEIRGNRRENFLAPGLCDQLRKAWIQQGLAVAEIPNHEQRVAEFLDHVVVDFGGQVHRRGLIVLLPVPQ